MKASSYPAVTDAPTPPAPPPEVPFCIALFIKVYNPAPSTRSSGNFVKDLLSLVGQPDFATDIMLRHCP